jgi:hypothetical protein
MAVIMAGRGRSLLKAVFAPLVAAFDALLSTVKNDRLVASGALGGDSARLLKHAPEEVVPAVATVGPRMTSW